jgi:hypothetical protein
VVFVDMMDIADTADTLDIVDSQVQVVLDPVVGRMVDGNSH